jgi:hypothetical protein
MPTVLHLVSRFNFGGTERQLVERLRRHPRGFEPILARFARSESSRSWWR